MKLGTIVLVTVLQLIKASQKNWIPIFVAFSGNGKLVHKAWKGESDASPIQADLTIDSRSHHLRSPIIDSWSAHNISQIKIELHSQDCMVAWMLFDGKGTTYLNWFRRDRLLLSSFDGIKDNKKFKHFRLRTFPIAPFLIHVKNWDCTSDSYWFMVLDKDGGCDWFTDGKYPLIMYTSNGTITNFHTDDIFADYMIVYVRI